ncbi:hypothetical protein C474_00872 [Halogeometricum pallidum JCM 14848]|uniref:Uncharacterized protein n=1 Tax=Halogeometricum pallidum JCM 14848 TaxID=1227487 RepID=M0DL31_HALPD|nr:hypothetical protein [Halogeometricum pallidum]ELZ34869.1 hypothetical protein C474_00872 [Halogeometricum pallidum JCM 14848]
MDLELLLWLLGAFFLAAAVFGVGLLAVTAWTATRVVDRLFVAVAPVRTGTPASVRDVETRVGALAASPHVDSGVVRAVVPESRRGRGRLHRRLRRTPGVRFDVALPLEGRAATLPVWTPVPTRLTGRTEFERVAAACGVAPERISDAVGEEVAVRRVGDEWAVGPAPATAQ